MKITVLDGYCLNPGDLSWERFKNLGELAIHDRTAAPDLLARAKGSEILLTNKTEISREVIEELDDLRYIGMLATGYNVVDVKAARDKGIPVTNVPIYGTRSVAQLVMGHLLNQVQPVAAHAAAVRQGEWSSNPDWCFWKTPLIELADLTLGIVGFGRIGRATARLGRALGMEILAHDVAQPEEPIDWLEFVDRDQLFTRSDVISLHCPLTPETERMVNESCLARMKKTAYLINTSRGQLVDEPALARALNRGDLAGAGLDVLSREPPLADNPLLSARNCTLTPHMAWATLAARIRLMDTVFANIEAFLRGEPANVVNR